MRCAVCAASGADGADSAGLLQGTVCGWAGDGSGASVAAGSGKVHLRR